MSLLDFLKMIMFILSAFSFTQPPDGIFKKAYGQKLINIDASGSSKQDINGSLDYTKPEYSIEPWDKRYDWCSNCGRSYDEHPWISYSLKSKKVKFNGYYIRAGCCYAGCCCMDDYAYCVHCCLYSWSLQISNDNKTWETVHKISKDDSMRDCKDSTYTLDKSYTTKYVRLIQDEACPGEPPCLAINRVELLGDIISDNSQSEEEEFVSFHDDDDVSIIGHISRQNRVRIV